MKEVKEKEIEELRAGVMAVKEILVVMEDKLNSISVPRKKTADNIKLKRKTHYANVLLTGHVTKPDRLRKKPG